MGNSFIPTNIDEYLRKRLMPVEGAIPQLPGIEMYGNSIPAGAVGGDLFEYINFQQRYDVDGRIQLALKRSQEYLDKLAIGAAKQALQDAGIKGKLVLGHGCPLWLGGCLATTSLPERRHLPSRQQSKYRRLRTQ